MTLTFIFILCIFNSKQSYFNTIMSNINCLKNETTCFSKQAALIPVLGAFFLVSNCSCVKIEILLKDDSDRDQIHGLETYRSQKIFPLSICAWQSGWDSPVHSRRSIASKSHAKFELVTAIQTLQSLSYCIKFIKDWGVIIST